MIIFDHCPITPSHLGGVCLPIPHIPLDAFSISILGAQVPQAWSPPLFGPKLRPCCLRVTKL